MSRRRNPKSWRFSDRYVMLFEWMLKSLAWQHATVYERCLYLEIRRRYNGRNNGDISLSQREAMKLLGCSNTPVERAFKGLIAKGFIKPQQRGSFDWKAGRRATRWLLTEINQDVPEYTAAGGTKEFMRWRPPEKNTARSRRADCPIKTGHSEKMARPDRAMKRKVTF